MRADTRALKEDEGHKNRVVHRRHIHTPGIHQEPVEKPGDASDWTLQATMIFLVPQ